MKRRMIMVAIFGLASMPALAADPPLPGSGATVRPMVVAPPPGMATQYPTMTTPYQTMAAPGCNQCYGGCGPTGGNFLHRLIAFVTFRPTMPCESYRRPSPYTPPLIAWFPCRETGRCASGCGTCGVGQVPLVLRGNQTGGAMAHRQQPAPMQPRQPVMPVAAAPAMQAVPSTPPTPPTPWSIPAARTTYAPTVPATTSYTANRPVSLAMPQPAPAPAPQGGWQGLPGGYRVQPSNYYLPK